MGTTTRVPLALIAARGKAGDKIEFSGAGLSTEPENLNANVKLESGALDSVTGTLSLLLSSGDVIKIEGFLTAGSAGQGATGVQGLPGRDGIDGLDGRDGEKGSTGCQGPAGPRGVSGPQGERGPQGVQGPTGPQGLTGQRGDDGFVQVWIQLDDPAEQSGSLVQAGAIWVKV